MKINSSVTKFLTNKLVLNIVLFLSVIEIIWYLTLGNLNAVLYFVVIGALVWYFSKNMIIILGVPLILVNLIVLAKSKNNKKEGFDTPNTSTPTNATTPTTPTTPIIPNATTTDSGLNSILKQNASPGTDSTSAGVNDAPLLPEGLTTEALSSSANSNPLKKPSESFKVAPAKKRKGGYDIDYASTVTEAYEQLNNILGSDGIKSLTKDTKHLMTQQMQLAEAMKGMEPLIKGFAPIMEKAQGLLGNFGNKEGLGNIMDMAKKLTGK